jgi:peptidoglycan hydrolase-like protein with peptidoglycan-binding domain
MCRNRTIKITIIGIFTLLIILKINQCLQYEPPAVQTPIPTTFEIQQRLKDWGLYKGDVDGVIGPQTLAAWQEAVYRQQAGEIEKRVEKAK